MNHGLSKTFTQEKSIEEYLQIKKLPIWETRWSLFGEQSQKNEHVLGFGDRFLPLLARLYENIHHMELLKGSEGHVCCLLWKTCVLGLRVKHRRSLSECSWAKAVVKVGMCGKVFLTRRTLSSFQKGEVWYPNVWPKWCTCKNSWEVTKIYWPTKRLQHLNRYAPSGLEDFLEYSEKMFSFYELSVPTLIS